MVRFRKAAKEDIEAVARMEKAIFQDAWSEKSIQETFLQKHAIITVAEKDGQVCAYCILYYVLDECEIARIAVDKTTRREGIGKRLLEYTCRCGTELQIQRMLLDVRESNAGARAFYQHFGFQEDGIRKDFYTNPQEDAILMSLAI